MITSRFTFTPEGPAPWGWGVAVNCNCDDVARLTLHESEGEWRLLGLGLLDGRRAGWAHNGQAVGKQPPAWLRRDVIDQLAAWALDELDTFEVQKDGEGS